MLIEQVSAIGKSRHIEILRFFICSLSEVVSIGLIAFLSVAIIHHMTCDTSNSTNFTALAKQEKAHDLDLFQGVATKHWSMDAGHQITYQRDDRHTLSLYLKGGTKNLRANQPGIKGAPGKICLMPQYQDSQWVINEKVEFVHLYFNDVQLKQYAAENLDLDVRFIELRELTFQQDEVLKKLFVDSFLLSRNYRHISPLFAEQSMQEVMQHLLNHYNGYTPAKAEVKGGLSPSHIRRLKDLIHSDMASKLSIAQLSEQVNLSPYHFARMFKLSFGESPASYITRVRINRIKQLLQESLSLVEISQQVGFSQQSHMTQYFKKLTGFTPAAYRQKL